MNEVENNIKLLLMISELLNKMINYNYQYNDINNYTDRIVHYIIKDLNNIITKYLQDIDCEIGESDD